MTKYDNVFFIDDDRISNYLSEHELKKTVSASEISQIQSFTNPIDGVDVLISKRHDLLGKTVLFLDINMPQISGWQVLDLLQQAEPPFENLDVYMLSSSMNPADIELAKKYSLVKDFYSKPFRSHVNKIFY